MMNLWSKYKKEQTIKLLKKYIDIIIPCLFIIIAAGVILGEIRLHQKIPDFNSLKSGEGEIIWSSYNKNAAVFKVTDGDSVFLVSSTIADSKNVGEHLDRNIGSQVFFLYFKDKMASTRNDSAYQYFYNVYDLRAEGHVLVDYKLAQVHQGRIDFYYNCFGVFFLICGITIFVSKNFK